MKKNLIYLHPPGVWQLKPYCYLMIHMQLRLLHKENESGQIDIMRLHVGDKIR